LGAIFSPDGSKVATSSADGQTRVWNLSAQLLQEFPAVGEVWQIAFSSDGKWLVTASLDKSAMVWDVERGALRLTLSHLSGVRAAAFRPGTSDVVTGSDDGEVRLWRTAARDLIDYLRGASTACLTPSERERFLGESEKKASSAYDACEAKHRRS
jgi:WD40 repeat protein